MAELADHPELTPVAVIPWPRCFGPRDVAAVAEAGFQVLRIDETLDATYKKARGDQKTGVEIVRRALRSPIKQLAENAGLDGAIVCQKVSEGKGNFGYNVVTEEYGDLVKMGVIVPFKVERVALQNAASVAGLLLTTDAIVSEIKEKDDDKKPPGGMPGY